MRGKLERDVQNYFSKFLKKKPGTKKSSGPPNLKDDLSQLKLIVADLENDVKNFKSEQ